MTCGLMTLTFQGTNELEKLVAEQEVVIAQTDRRFTAARADYNGTNSLLDLTGNPRWQAGVREGPRRLDAVEPGERGDAGAGKRRMKLPASEVGRLHPHRSRARPKPPQLKQDVAGFAEIYSQAYLVTPASALFHRRRARRASPNEVDLR